MLSLCLLMDKTLAIKIKSTHHTQQYSARASMQNRTSLRRIQEVCELTKTIQANVRVKDNWQSQTESDTILSKVQGVEKTNRNLRVSGVYADLWGIWVLHIAKVGYFFSPLLPNAEWLILGPLPFFFYQKLFIFRFLVNCFGRLNLHNGVVKWRCQMALSNGAVKRRCKTALSNGAV